MIQTIFMNIICFAVESLVDNKSSEKHTEIEFQLQCNVWKSVCASVRDAIN